MTVTVRAGTTTTELTAALTEAGQRCALPERGGTVGGSVVIGENHPEVLGRGWLTSSVLQVTYISSEGKLIRGGGPTVKNVSGFDLPRLIVGSLERSDLSRLFYGQTQFRLDHNGSKVMMQIHLPSHPGCFGLQRCCGMAHQLGCSSKGTSRCCGVAELFNLDRRMV